MRIKNGDSFYETPCVEYVLWFNISCYTDRIKMHVTKQKITNFLNDACNIKDSEVAIKELATK